MIIYLDDSGVLDSNHPVKHFVYAGYIFISKDEKDYAKRRYISTIKNIRRSSGRVDELKAAKISIKSKRKLYQVMKPFHSIAAHVWTDKIYESILSNNLSKHRYKDYVVKMLVKKSLKNLIDKELIKSDDDINIILNVDEQPTSSDGFYGLRESIYEELKFGITNWDYGSVRPPLFTAEVKVSVHYFVSEHNYLGQSADIIANRIWVSYCHDDISLRQRDKHFLLTLP